jgi:hypothetical protein
MNCLAVSSILFIITNDFYSNIIYIVFNYISGIICDGLLKVLRNQKHKHFYKLLLTKYKDCASMST